MRSHKTKKPKALPVCKTCGSKTHPTSAHIERVPSH